MTIAVAALNVALWAFLNRPVHIADWNGEIGGLAYNASQRYQDPTRGLFPSEDDLARDMRILAQYTKRLRLYQSTETPQVPRLARFYGMSVMGGAWLDKRIEHNERELEGLIALSRKYDNIDRAVVGNETVLLGNLSPQQLIGYLDRARAQLKIPVSTAEPLDTWQRHPELIRHVDFVTVHILPYWEFVPRKDAIGWVLGQYRAVRKLVTDQGFPDKPVVIGEVGWPSNGDRRKTAQPSLADEAHFLREWFNVAKKENLDYYIMEAIDQPWKAANEGLAGAYWGV
ncbi:MAG TPA: benzoate transporter, partial [Rhodanobacteraceae bacterium]